MKNKLEQATFNFYSGFNCAQSVVSTYSEKFGLKKEDALKISSGFGAGMGRMQNICGAISGAFIVIGLAKGNTKVEDENKREETYSLIKIFTERFEKEHKSILCKDLLKCDLGTVEGKKYFEEEHLFERVCIPCVKKAMSILEEILG